MTTIRAQGSLLSASADDRTLTFRLLPYGEQGRTSSGRVTASKGRLTLPDVSTLVGNMEHEGKRPVSRAVSLSESDDGLDLTVRVLATSSGNDLLIEAAEGVRTGVSVEIDNPIIRQGALIGGALTGYGHVTTPAFPSAQLVAADAGDLPDDFPDWLVPGERSSASTETVTVDGRTFEVTTTSTSSTQVEEIDAPGTSGGITEGDSPTTQEAAMADATLTDEKPVEDQDQTVEETETQEDEVTKDDEKVTASAVAKAPVGGVAARMTASRVKQAEPTFIEVTERLSAAYQSGGQRGLQAALSDIVPANLTSLGQPAYLGELWSGKAHERRFAPLFNHGDLTSIKGVAGWRWTTKPTVAAYTGGKTAVPSAVVATEAVTATPKRLAGAHDVDRIYRDFQDTEFYSSYYKAMAESYSKLSDAAALAAAVAGATVHAPAAASFPVAANVPEGLALIVKGALKVLDGTDTMPTFAVIGTALYESILYTPQNLVLTYLNAALGLEEGTLSTFRILPSASASLTGKALVGAKDAMTFYELPGSPIRAEAIDMVNGGVDGGLFGYYTTIVHDADGLALVNKGA